jgi:hypothetical protein
MPRVTLKIEAVRDVCMNHPGMWQDFQKSSKVRGDELELSRTDFDSINQSYFGRNAIGSLLHKLFKPAAIVLDEVLGTNLQECGGCAERELKINDVTGG